MAELSQGGGILLQGGQKLVVFGEHCGLGGAGRGGGRRRRTGLIEGKNIIGGGPHDGV